MRFELIKGTKSLQGTCYFEFVKHSNKNKPCWNENALYLKDEVFSFFANVFSKSSDRFDYFNFCKFNQFELKSLSKNLNVFIEKLNSLQNFEEYKSLFENEFINIFIDGENEDDWKLKVKELRQIARELKNIVDESLQEKEILWVLGL